MQVRKCFLIASLGFLSWGALAEPWDSLGPLYRKGELTLGSGYRKEILGPLVIREQNEAASSWTFASIVSGYKDLGTDSREFDLLYPLLTYDRFGSEYRLQLFQLFSLSGGKNSENLQNNRFTVFPFYFQQRSPDPALTYTALVPFYGQLKNRLLWDDIHFVLFPLYARTQKRDVVTDNYVYPVVHLRHGEGLKGWQVWPLIGRERKDVTTRTNNFGETETIGGHDKNFVLWPFYIDSRSGLGTESPATQRAILPFFSIQRSPLRDSSTYLWPFGVTYTEDREKKYREWDAPWPLVVFARGEGKTANRIWPLFSQARSSTLQSDFYLWPLYKYNRITSEPLDRQRARVLFFLYSDLIERNTTSGTGLRRTDLWPLFTAHQDHQGNERLQFLAPLEPLLPNNKSIERNYSPLWSIWRSEKNGRTGAASQSLLWNLYRHDMTSTSKKYSLLFGLFHYQSGPEGNRWRVFYIPVVKTKKTMAIQPQLES